MISRRENLLIKPWEQRRYNNHRRKVELAGPAIDNKPPVSREHVMLKLKKKQREIERCEEIEKNNFLLLKKMNHIMKTSRVDNHWTTPQPNFLNRIAMFDTMNPTLEDIFQDDNSVTDSHPDEQCIRQTKCYACVPYELPKTKIPEDRIPWEPEKLPIARVRSKSVPVRKPNVVREQTLSGSITSKRVHEKSVTFEKNLPRQKSVQRSKPIKRDIEVNSPQSLFLSRGCLKLNVNFPSDTFVKFQMGNQEKVLMHGMCNCKSTSLAV